MKAEQQEQAARAFNRATLPDIISRIEVLAATAEAREGEFTVAFDAYMAEQTKALRAVRKALREARKIAEAGL